MLDAFCIWDSYNFWNKDKGSDVRYALTSKNEFSKSVKLSVI